MTWGRLRYRMGTLVWNKKARVSCDISVDPDSEELCSYTARVRAGKGKQRERQQSEDGERPPGGREALDAPSTAATARRALRGRDA